MKANLLYLINEVQKNNRYKIEVVTRDNEKHTGFLSRAEYDGSLTIDNGNKKVLLSIYSVISVNVIDLTNPRGAING